MIPQLHLPDYLLRSDDQFQIADTLIKQTDFYHSDVHFHDYYEFYFVMDGEVMEYLNGSWVYVQKGQCGIREPKDCHVVLSSEHFARNVVRNIAVRSDCFEEHLSKLSCSMKEVKKTAFLSGSCFAEFLTMTSMAMQNMSNQVVFNYILSQALGNVLINARYKTLDDDTIPRWLRILHAEMEKKENFVAGYAKMMEMTDKSQEHVARSFKKYYHIKPTEYINMKRLEYAASQLQVTDKKIIEIAFESGFDNLPYFNKVFKRQYILTPKDFREKMISMSI